LATAVSFNSSFFGGIALERGSIFWNWMITIC
jgi:hypothetical protein